MKQLYTEETSIQMESSTDEEEFDSYSQQSSSDTTKEGKTQQFSVSRSDANGLRMKISAIRNVVNSTTNSKMNATLNNNSKTRAPDAYSSKKRRKRKVSTATSSSCCSICSRTESDFSSEAFSNNKPKKAKTKRKKIVTGTSNQIKGNNGSTDSDEEPDKSGISEKIVSSSLTNMEQTQAKKVSQCDVLQGSCISSSDNEIPALVNAAIKCVESGSEADNNISSEPTKQYTSTLLRDFMVKTQMLGNSSTMADKHFSTEVKSNTNGSNETLNNSNNISYLRRRRGRPKKSPSTLAKVMSLESADSGITSTAQSLSPSPSSHNKKANKSVEGKGHYTVGTQKINISSLDKQMYATERVLYPPKGRKKSIKQNIKAKVSNEDMLDPLWKKIDVNMKFRRPSLSGYKSDGGTTICSKILAARSGYVSDYCSVGNRVYSGYKSDISGKSRSSIKSYISRAKSCDYRYGYNIRKNKKFRKRNHSLIKPSKSLGNVNEQDILQLAGLSLGQTSEDSSRESICKPLLMNCQSKKFGEINRFVRTGEYYGRNKKTRIENNTLCETIEPTLDSAISGFEYNTKISNALQRQISSNENTEGFPKKIRSRRSSAISRCSSFSTLTRSDIRRKKRRRLRLKCSKNSPMDSKLNTEIEILSNNLASLNLTSIDKINTKDKEKEKIPGVKNLGKRNIKKRKLSENVEHHLPNMVLKRRHKKAGHSNPDEHKLPLKKRHYLLTPGEKSDSKNIHILDIKSKDVAVDAKILSTKSSTSNNVKITSKAVTPKKRHLLETGDNIIRDESINSVTKPSCSPSVYESKIQAKVDASVDTVCQKSINQGKTDKDVTKKKNRLEVLVSKMHNSNHSIKDGAQISVAPPSGFPPPGVFEPSMELEIQIPVKLSAGTIMKSEVDSPKLPDFGDLEKPLPEPKSEGVLESLLSKTTNNLLLKRKRRKTFNRTGFPTIKRKKRKTISECSDSVGETKYGCDSTENDINTVSKNGMEAGKLCDRVPCVGEASDSFLERHRQPRLSVVSLEKLQEPIKKQENIESPEVVVRIPRTNSLKEALDKCSNMKCKNDTKSRFSIRKYNIQNKPTKKLLGSVIKNNKISHCSNKTFKSSKNNLDVKPDGKLLQVEGVNKMTVGKKHPLSKRGESNNSRQQWIKEQIRIKGRQVNNTLKSIGKTRSVCDNAKANKVLQKESNHELSLTEDLEQEPLPPNEGPKIIDNTFESLDNGLQNKRLTKWKKSYITAGLLSDFYKTNKTKKSVREMVKRRCDLFISKQTSNLLPPPPYCEKFLRRTVRDFVLPYDIWWAYQNSKLPVRVTVPSWNYKKIRTNVYGDVRPNPTVDHQPCNCKPQTACGDDCLNRMVYTECSPSNCPCGEKCQNQKIQRHDIAPGIERFMTENKGWGVRTNLPIKKGTYILEYVGEVVTEKEFKERMATLYVNDTHHYCLHLDGGLVIDGHRMGSDGRFVNHSCSPNCEMQKWSVNGLFRMALFASRNIQAGEELTYDYNFSLFNPSEGQPCRCDTPQCRGVIGGKSQRIKPLDTKPIETIIPQRTSRTRKRQARRITNRLQTKDIVVSTHQQISDREKRIVWGKKCFLIRNLEKVRKMRTKMMRKNSETPYRPLTPSSLAAQITALRVPRNIRTRGLTLAEHDPEVERMAKIAVILREICIALENVKDCEGKSQISKLLQASKKKRNVQERNCKIIDFPTVQSNIEKGFYKEPQLFDEDINKLFSNALMFFGSDSEEGKIVRELINIYLEKKNEMYDRLSQLVPDKKLKNFRRPPPGARIQTNCKTHEDVIQCICGLFKDEGLMIQCAKCLVWQHAECTKANVNADNYLCEKCEPRVVDLEIPLDEYTEEGYRYYLSLLRGSLQIRQTDTVYVLRDIPVKDETGKVCATKKHTYETIGKIDYSECDIFRIERLWKDNEGKRFIFGHHYLRPHETFHEPTRKFYENEVIRVPLYEVVPIELVIARCWVLDRSTFCKGRPVDCTSEEHVYICELRVDRSARFFSKVKQSYPTCTKNYAFKRFPEKLKISRTYAPHEVDPALIKPKKKKTDESVNQQKKNASPVIQLLPPPTKTINEKRLRLEKILKTLRRRQTTLQNSAPVDLSYLLTGRGARQRRAVATNVPI